MAFAKKIDAPIGCSMMGLSAVHSSSPLMLGMTGMHGAYASSRMKGKADVIIGVGVRFSDRATGDKVAYQKDTHIIHIDIDEAEIDKNIPAACSVLGDIKAILPRLTEMVKQNKHDKWHELALEYKEFANEKYRQEGFVPRNIIKTVRQYTKPETIIATDVGQHQIWTAQHYRFENPRTFLTSGGLGTMGFGVGACNGASVATGKGKTVLFTGDGSFHMNLNEIGTAVMHKLPIVVIIMNNNVLGMVRQWQGLFYENRFSQTTMNRPTDYKMLAQAFGAAGYNAMNQSELEAALGAAFASDMPTIINCVIDPDEKVMPMIPPGKSVSEMIVE
jgi:acetolactate synthase-1/2/3 large subunit